MRKALFISDCVPAILNAHCKLVVEEIGVRLARQGLTVNADLLSNVEATLQEEGA